MKKHMTNINEEDFECDTSEEVVDLLREGVFGNKFNGEPCASNPESKYTEYRGKVEARNSQPIPQKELYNCCINGREGDAKAFSIINKGKYLFDISDTKWYFWDKHHWTEDLGGNVYDGVRGVVDAYKAEIFFLKFEVIQAQTYQRIDVVKALEGQIKKYLGKVLALQGKKCMDETLALASTNIYGMNITGDKWDVTNGCLAVSNGIVDLATGVLRSGQPTDYIKTFCPTEWKGCLEPCPVWTAAIEEILDADYSVIRFMQRVFGYSIGGDKDKERIFLLLAGPEGQNGKGTIIEAIRIVLGGIAAPIDSEMLLNQQFSRSSAAPSPDVMNLRGKKIIWASETNEGRMIDLGKLKLLTGGDTLVARAPFAKHTVTFRPTHTLFLITNNIPRADANDSAFWKRLRLIEFKNSFVENPDPGNPLEKKADLDLMRKLEAERSGILAWLVNGYFKYINDGINTPEVVIKATQAYREDEDTIGMFIKDQCVLRSDVSIQAVKLYNNYSQWTEERGFKPFSINRFGKMIQKKVKRERNRNGSSYLGICLTGDEPAPF